MPDAASDSIISLYDRNAEAWDRVRGKNLLEAPWLKKFLSLVPTSGTILDIGCGSGEPFARYFVEAGYRVTGIDSSENLIALCRARMPDHTWHVSDMRTLAPGKRFDGLIAWDSVFHLSYDDQRAMFPIFKAHAAPGAALMFTAGPGHGEAIGTFGGEPLYHASLSPDEYRSLLADNGFAVVEFTPEDPECGGHTIWLARQVAAT